MITFPAIADTQYGLKPYLEFRAQWHDNGPVRVYRNNIISVGSVQSTINVSDNGTSQSVEVVLDDTDGLLVSLFSTTDFHKRPAWLYQGFEGEATLTLLFKGEISTPVEWTEGGRELKVTIISKIEDTEVGFSVEQGNFVTIPEDAIGKAWPIGFGSVCKQEALKLTKPVASITLDTFGIPDPSLVPQIEFMSFYNQAASVPTAILYLLWLNASEAQSYCQRMQDLALEHLRQYQYAVGSVRVQDADKFPQNQMVWVKIADKRFRGHFTEGRFYFEGGNDSTDQYELYQMIVAANQAEAEGPPNTYNPFKSISTIYSFGNAGANATCRNHTYGRYHRPRHPDGEPEYIKPDLLVTDGQLGIHGATQGDFRDPAKTYTDVNFFWWGAGVVRLSLTGYVEQRGYFEASAGSSIVLDDNEPIDYVVSLIGAENIQLCAKLRISDQVEILSGVPAAWYSIVFLTINGQDATLIRLQKPLSRFDERFSDDALYVSYDSEVGPNAVDVMEWLIDTYSTMTYDSTTFDDVKAKIDCYGVGFTVYDKRKLTELLSDISYQSRCGLLMRNGVYYLKYLSETPSSVKTYTTNSDIHLNTYSLSIAPSTEDLTTRSNVSWTNCGEDQFVVLRNNIAKYGDHSRDIPYFIYADANCIIKSATFWLIRDSNAWKHAKFTVSLSRYLPETLDAVTLDGQLMVVQSSTYDPNTFTLDLECWVPVRIGESSTYLFAFPANLPQYTSYGVAAPTVGTSINAGYGGVAVARNDTGDQYPSDTGDVCCVTATTTCQTYEPIIGGPTVSTTPTPPLTLGGTGPTVTPNENNGQGGGAPTGNYGCIGDNSPGGNNGLDDALQCLIDNFPSGGGDLEQDGNGWTYGNGEVSCSWQPALDEEDCHGGREYGNIQFNYSGPGTASLTFN